MIAPSSSPPPYSLTPPEVYPIALSDRRTSSSPMLRTFHHGSTTSTPLRSRHPHPDFRDSGRRPETTEEEDSSPEAEEGMIFTARGASFAQSIRQRLLGHARTPPLPSTRPITTAPGALCAGDTETENEDSPRTLPTARLGPRAHLRLPASLVPALFEFFRLLAIVPAMCGTLWNAYNVLWPPGGDQSMRVEYSVAVLWSILTGWQCLQLATGLLKRWRVYYSTLPTLIRLLALQAICWPATSLTLTVLGHAARPLVCWAVIGTTTCCSRAVQLWVTSNIVSVPAPSHSRPPSCAGLTAEERMKRGSRRTWDWGAVGARCALPAALVYFVMAWAVVLRREVLGC